MKQDKYIFVEVTKTYMMTKEQGKQSEVDYNSIDVDAVRASLKTIFDKFPTGRSPSEAQTEDDLIWPRTVTH